MTELNAHEDNPDGLEITSIGSLYAGPWDKKYWSSSRGKERYPYPVGYQASRAHNGNKYTIEIHEGPKGPSFLITSPDGNSSSGQTPNITWEKFQKKYCPRTKIWQGKRFSCNIDGVEFFGFKNPFVQRLLREMAANFSRSAEQNLLSSGYCKEIPKADDTNCSLDALSKSPDLLPSVKRSKLAGKKSKRLEVKNTMLSSSNSRKKSRSRDLKFAAEDSYHIKDGQSICGVNSLHSTKEGCDGCEKPAVLPQSLNLVPDLCKKGLVEENESPSNNIDTLKKVRNNVSAEEKRLFNDSEYASTGAGSLANKKIPLDRLQGTDVEDGAFPIEVAAKEKESTRPVDVQVLNDIGFAPDTLDQECTSDNNPSTQDTINHKLKDQVSEDDPIASKNPMTESHKEEEIGEFNCNADSGKSDFDSVDQETAESMMSFLLPQAIPLLGRTLRKKKAKVTVLEALPSGMNSKQENKENNLACQEALSSSECKFNQNTSEADSCFCNKCGQSTVIGNHKNSLDCCLEAIGNKNIFCSNQVHMDSSVMLQHSDVPEETTDATVYLVENSKDVVVCYHEKGLTVPDSIDSAAATDSIDDIREKGILISSNVQLKEAGMQTEPVKTDNTPVAQSPVCVYSRKRKIQSKSQTKGKYNVSLSESIICRSSGDGTVTDTCPTARHLDTLETRETSPLDEKSHEKGLSGVGLEVSKKSKSSIADTPTMDSNTLQNSLVSAVKQDLSFKCASKDIDAVECFEQLDSEVQKFAVHIDKEVVPDKNISVSISCESFQKEHSKVFKSSSVAGEFQYGGSDFKPKTSSIKKDFLGILKQVGYYNHPLPVLSVMVCTGITEIHICVVCDLSVGKDMTLFMYKVSTQEPTLGVPSFLGHTVITLPTLKDYFGREISVERSGLQFTPGGHSLVSLDSIKMPYCSQGKISCLCSTCASRSFDRDTVKIVKVKFGFVTVVAKLKTIEILQCALVCEPDYLIAVGESGRLHLWVMNSAWSAQTGKYSMPSNDIMSPGIVELKRIPKCNSLVIGHNGFGEFSLWDISKRTIVSKFSGSSSSVCDFLPIGMFRWKKDSQVSSGYDVDGHINRMIASTNAWFSDQTSACSVSPFEEDVAVWVLVSADSESDAQDNFMSQDFQSNLAGLWRLALLVKNTVLLGSTLDPSASAIGASSGHGIVGTSEGLVYVWEMATGAQLGTLHQFNGKAASCIATDDTTKGAVAIAGGDQVLVYLPMQ